MQSSTEINCPFGKLQSYRKVFIIEALSFNNSEGRLVEQREVVPDLIPTQENDASSEVNLASDSKDTSQRRN